MSRDQAPRRTPVGQTNTTDSPLKIKSGICMCTLPWCNTLFKGRCVKQGDLPSLGSVGITQVPDEHKQDLKGWLKDVLCTNMSEDWLDTCVESRKLPPWASMRIGRWHFDDTMFKKWKGGTTVLDWDSKTKPYPSKSCRDCEHLVVKSSPTVQQRVEKRAHAELAAAAGEDCTSSLKVMANVSQRALEAELENQKLRQLLKEAQKHATKMTKLSAERQAEQEELLKESEQGGADLAALLAAQEMAQARDKAWLSHDKLLNDPVIRKQCKALTFFPTPEAHAACFDLLNYSGAADALVFYRPDNMPDGANRKRKVHTRILGRRMIAQDQFLMVSVILVTGMPFGLVGAMFGGVSEATVSRIFMCWINFLYLFMQSEMPPPTREQVIKAMPPKFMSVFKTDKIRMIIDCTEMQMEKPTEPMAFNRVVHETVVVCSHPKLICPANIWCNALQQQFRFDATGLHQLDSSLPTLPFAQCTMLQVIVPNQICKRLKRGLCTVFVSELQQLTLAVSTDAL
jgi:hypothetical protein